MAWLRLVRWKNLLIIFLAQFVAWWCVVLPLSPLVLGLSNFLCLAISTMLIAAAGYVINDYFDIKIDAINKPDKVVLERLIPRRQAIILHSVLNGLALVIAGYVAAQAHHYEWLLLQMFCTLLLWFYSTHLKRQYITGNLAVALLTALSILSLFVYEPAMHYAARLPVSGASSSLPVWVLVIYAYFAFMLTWMREIVKDMEDLEGDEAEGCVTMPIRKGLDYSTRFITALAIMAIIPLAIAAYPLFTHNYKLLSSYIVLLLVLPLVLWSVYIRRGGDEAHYNNASHLLKLIMILGICSLLIYHT